MVIVAGFHGTVGVAPAAGAAMALGVCCCITEADPDGCAACTLAQHPEDAYRNSPAYGAYEVAMMKRTLELEARVAVRPTHRQSGPEKHR